MLKEEVAGRYADETTTGKLVTSLRDFNRITLTLRVDEPADGFEWVRRLRSEFQLTELKWKHISHVVDSQPRLRELVESRVGESFVVVVDLAEHTRSLITEIAQRYRIKGQYDEAWNALLRTGVLPHEFAQRLIDSNIDHAVNTGTISRVEELVQLAARTAGMPPGIAGTLVDRSELSRLNTQQKRELIGRFSTALGESLDPRRQADSVVSAISAGRFLASDASGTAFATLTAQLSPDLTFDKGTAGVASVLESATARVRDLLQAASHTAAVTAEFTFGKIDHEGVSSKLDGLQAADVAAGLALRIFEADFVDVATSSKRLASNFRRVMLNDRFVD